MGVDAERAQQQGRLPIQIEYARAADQARQTGGESSRLRLLRVDQHEVGAGIPRGIAAVEDEKLVRCHVNVAASAGARTAAFVADVHPDAGAPPGGGQEVANLPEEEIAARMRKQVELASMLRARSSAVQVLEAATRLETPLAPSGQKRGHFIGRKHGNA